MSRKHFYILFVILVIYTFPLASFCNSDTRVTVLNQGTGIIELQYSPNGRWLAVRSSTMVVLYDALTFEQKHVLLKDGNHLIHPTRMAFSPDSTLLATRLPGDVAWGGKIILWDVETATECPATQALDAIGFSFREALFSPDGFLLARGKRKLILWDIWRRRVQATIPNVPELSSLTSLTFRPDGKVLAGIVGNQKPPVPHDVLTLWDTRTGERLATAHENVESIDYSPDGRFLAVSHLNRTKLLRVSDGQVLHTFNRGRGMAVFDNPVFSPDSRFLVVNGPDGLELWDVQTGEIRHTFKGKDIRTFAVNPDGRTLATGIYTSGDFELIFWDVETGETKKPFPWREGRDVIFNTDGTLITGVISNDPTTSRSVPTLIHWDIEDPKPLKEIDFRVESGEQINVKLSPDGRWFAIAQRGNLEVVSTENGQRLWRLKQPFIESSPIVFSLDGRFLAAAHFQSETKAYWVSVWETQSGIEYRRLSSLPFVRLAFSPDGTTLAIGEPGGKNTLGIDEIGGEIRFWDIHTGVMTRELQGEQTRLRSLAFSPDGKILAAGGGVEIDPFRSQPTIQLWDVPTGKPLHMIEGSGYIDRLVFSPDGQILAADDGVENNTVTLWSVADKRELLSLGGLDVEPGALAFSPDGRRFVTAGRATLVWNLPELLDPFPPIPTTQLKPAQPVSRPVLLPNFPNPANPETWIPYQLHTDVSVRISIYDLRGRLVRLLDIGHRAAGQYTCHCKAAYWDGTNALGERVTSGVYFYTIEAGDFRGTRKMVIKK